MLDLIRQAYETFREHDVDDPLGEALRLLDIITAGRLRSRDPWLSVDGDPDLAAVARARRDGAPLEYALGYALFMGRVFRASPGALIPRSETELLARTAIDLAVDLADPPFDIIDIGTGCGNLSITLAHEVPDARVHATDITRSALALAEDNVRLHGVAERVQLYLGSLFEPLEGTGLKGGVDMVVCNPPYIPRAKLKEMDAAIRDHEPVEAFDGGDFGIDVLRGLVAGAEEYLRLGGFLVFEIGAGQERLVNRLFRNRGFADIDGHADEQGLIRVFSARRHDA